MPQVLAALADTPVVLLHGARQAGKSTLAQVIAAEAHPARYLTLDDPATLTAARGDAAGFILGLEGKVVIDEVQRAPELLIAIKAAVDRGRQPGRFLLTGSANILLLPQLSESLAGRMEILTLWPLSQGEIEGEDKNFVNRVFAPRLILPADGISRADLVQRIVMGGYPEVVLRRPPRRAAWFRSYITTILQRDVRDIMQIERLDEMPRLLAVLAGRTGTLLNVADLSRTLGIPQTTLHRYLTLLQATFLIQLVPAWTANVRKRLLKTPKIILADTGLAAHLGGMDGRGLMSNAELWGAFLEAFVAMELLKQMTWSKIRPTLYHFRTAKGEGVDLVLEAPSGELVAVEVKAAAALGADDFRGLRTLAAIAGRRFKRGVLLYLGAQALPFGQNLYAFPIPSLWTWRVASDRRSVAVRSRARVEQARRH